jgi:glutaconyl-CoA/methylmalonyl-CoA decarboxylase subunit gamma
MKKYMISLNDKIYKVDIEEVTPETEEVITKIDEGSAEGGDSALKGSEGTAVKSPIPGEVFNIIVKVGEEVKKNQVLLVLEAMKMENEIVSTVDGKIASIEVAKGDSVISGQVLVQIG